MTAALCVAFLLVTHPHPPTTWRHHCEPTDLTMAECVEMLDGGTEGVTDYCEPEKDHARTGR